MFIKNTLSYYPSLPFYCHSERNSAVNPPYLNLTYAGMATLARRERAISTLKDMHLFFCLILRILSIYAHVCEYIQCISKHGYDLIIEIRERRSQVGD